MQGCSTGLLQLTKLNRERGLASAWLEHTVQRHLPKQTAKGYVQIFPSQTSVGGGCFNAPRQRWYQDTLAAQLTSRDWWRALFPCKSWDSQFKRNVKGKYYISTQDESNSAGSHFFLKAQEYGGRGEAGEWKDNKFAQNTGPLSIEQCVVVLTGFLSTEGSYKGVIVCWGTGNQVLSHNRGPKSLPLVSGKLKKTLV